MKILKSQENSHYQFLQLLEETQDRMSYVSQFSPQFSHYLHFLLLFWTTALSKQRLQWLKVTEKTMEELNYHGIF